MKFAINRSCKHRCTKRDRYTGEVKVWCGHEKRAELRGFWGKIFKTNFCIMTQYDEEDYCPLFENRYIRPPQSKSGMPPLTRADQEPPSPPPMKLKEIKFPYVEINQPEDFPYVYSVKIDGKEFNTVKNIDISMGVGKISTIKLEFYAKVDIKGPMAIEDNKIKEGSLK